MSELTQLGRQTALPASPSEAVLETVRNPAKPGVQVVRFTVPEFTSLCPVTGQPDFARFVIDYVPTFHLIESKSLKLYMGSFRNHGAFHEECTAMISESLWTATAPAFLRVCAFWYPRGGIPIDVFWQRGELPSGLYLPEPGVTTYAGR